MDKHRILFETCTTYDEAQALQSEFHLKFGIPIARILIHPDNIADPASKAAARITYGDVILSIPASPFPDTSKPSCGVRSGE